MIKKSIRIINEMFLIDWWSRFPLRKIAICIFCRRRTLSVMDSS